MTDIYQETLVPIKDVPKHLPKRNGKRLNLSTVYRWKQRGLDGIVLETCYVGGQQFTSVEALQRFNEAITTLRNGPRSTFPMASTPMQAGRAHEIAKRKLEKIMGITKDVD